MKPNTYTQIHIQIVFAVRYRAALIRPEWKTPFHQFATGIIQENRHKLLQINSMPDHVHALIGLRPHHAISDLVSNLKSETSKWFKQFQSRRDQPFAWQDGYGAFSYSRWDVDKIIHYIQQQEDHHRKKTFLEEYRDLLEEAGIDWKDRFIFSVPE